MIEVRNLSKKYDDKTVVHNVSLKIEKGKITSFIGPNGAGKSTALSMITRLMKRDSGQVFIEGKELENWDKKELSKKIAILKQSNNINIRLTVRELVSFGRFPYCEGKLTEEDNKYVDEAIEYMRLTEFEHRYLDELSGGQCQRAAIARALSAHPKILVCDEATSALDVSVQAQIVELLKEMQEKMNISYLFITHDLALVSSFCDRVAVMKNGKIVEVGDAKEVINNPKDEYTKLLIKSAYF